MTTTSAVPDTSSRWTLWHRDTFDRDTPESVAAQGTNIFNGLYQLWKQTLREGVTGSGDASFGAFRLVWGETVKTTAAVWVKPFGNAELAKLKRWAEAIGEDALLLRIAALHLTLLQKSSRWSAQALNPSDEARELLRRVSSLRDPAELGVRIP